MDANILKTVGQIAGIGGLAIGMIVIVFRRVISKLVGEKLSKKQTYNVLMTIVICSWSIAVLGIGAWFFVTISQAQGSAEVLVGDTRPDGIVKKWQKTRMIMKDLSVYVSAKERGPKAFVSKNGFLAKLRVLDFPDDPNIFKTRNELISMLKDAPTVETGMQQDMELTKDIVVALDRLFYLIRLEAINQGLSDWLF